MSNTRVCFEKYRRHLTFCLVLFVGGLLTFEMFELPIYQGLTGRWLGDPQYVEFALVGHRLALFQDLLLAVGLGFVLVLPGSQLGLGQRLGILLTAGLAAVWAGGSMVIRMLSTHSSDWHSGLSMALPLCRDWNLQDVRVLTFALVGLGWLVAAHWKRCSQGHREASAGLRNAGLAMLIGMFSWAFLDDPNLGSVGVLVGITFMVFASLQAALSSRWQASPEQTESPSIAF